MKIPTNEIRLKARSGSEMEASASAQRFHHNREMPTTATSQIAATHREVTQSQLITEDVLDAEQLQGLDAITKPENSAVSRARAANTNAMALVALSLALGGAAIAKV